MNMVDKGVSIRAGSVDMTHGGGGRAMAELIADLFQRHLGNPILAQGNDGALLEPQNGRLVMSTDGHVISPLFFPGGDIGSLSVHGTLNDVAMTGARPLYLTAGFILEEGFPLASTATKTRAVTSWLSVRPKSPVTFPGTLKPLTSFNPTTSE